MALQDASSCSLRIRRANRVSPCLSVSLRIRGTCSTSTPIPMMPIESRGRALMIVSVRRRRREEAKGVQPPAPARPKRDSATSATRLYVTRSILLRRLCLNVFRRPRLALNSGSYAYARAHQPRRLACRHRVPEVTPAPSLPNPRICARSIRALPHHSPSCLQRWAGSSKGA